MVLSILAAGQSTDPDFSGVIQHRNFRAPLTGAFGKTHESYESRYATEEESSVLWVSNNPEDLTVQHLPAISWD
jgi:hypothetical protein